MSDDKVIVLVCMPVGNMRDPVRGSTIARCGRCNTPVWLSPSSRPVVMVAKLLCPGCAKIMADKTQAEGEPVRFGGFLPGQLDELLNEGDKSN